jgi:hypothetical protein
LGNVRALRFQIDLNLARISTKTNIVHSIANITDRLPGNGYTSSFLRRYRSLPSDHGKVFRNHASQATRALGSSVNAASDTI